MIILIALLLFPSVGEGRCLPRGKEIKAQVFMLPALQLLDVHSTSRALAIPGHVEGNPLMRGMVTQPLIVQYGLKGGVGAMQSLLLWKMSCRHPTWAKWLGRGLNGFMGSIVLDNYILTYDWMF